MAAPRRPKLTAEEALSEALDATAGAFHVIADASAATIIGSVAIDQTTDGTTNKVNTELPAARLAADNLALPTAPDVLAVLMGYDGSTLDMIRAISPASDAMSPDSAGALVSIGLNNVFNGTNWDRMRGTAARGVITNQFAAAGGLADAVSNTVYQIIEQAGNAMYTFVRGQLFNESTWDRQRGNTAVVGLASAARTTTTSTPDQVNYNGRTVKAVINVSSITSTPVLTPTLEGKDSISGSYYTILTGQAIIATGLTVLEMGVGLTPVPGLVANRAVPRTYRLTLTALDADSATYSVSFENGV